jgi:hypothetical protein
MIGSGYIGHTLVVHRWDYQPNLRGIEQSTAWYVKFKPKHQNKRRKGKTSPPRSVYGPPPHPNHLLTISPVSSTLLSRWARLLAPSHFPQSLMMCLVRESIRIGRLHSSFWEWSHFILCLASRTKNAHFLFGWEQNRVESLRSLFGWRVSSIHCLDREPYGYRCTFGPGQMGWPEAKKKHGSGTSRP